MMEEAPPDTDEYVSIDGVWLLLESMKDRQKTASCRLITHEIALYRYSDYLGCNPVGINILSQTSELMMTTVLIIVVYRSKKFGSYGCLRFI